MTVKGNVVVTVLTDPADGSMGTVTDISGTYAEGSKITLTASPVDGYKLSGWYIGTNKLTLDANNQVEIPTTNETSITITAKFATNSSEIPEGVTTRATYGKYVNYNINLGIGNKNDVTDDWKVFYDDGTNIFIIAADIVPTTNTLLGNIMTNIGAITNNKTTHPYSVYWDKNNYDIKCNTYKNGTRLGPSNGAADIFTNRPTGTAFLEGKGLLGFWKAQATTSRFSNAKMTASLMDTKVWEGFAGGTLPQDVTGSSYAIGGPTLSMWVESWNKTRTTKIYYNRAKTYGYYVNESSQPSTDNYRVNLSSNTDYTEIKRSDTNYTNDLYFPRATDIYWNWCFGYWLASPSAYNSFDVMSVSFGGNLSNSMYNYESIGVRPVVCLPSGIGLKTHSGSNYYDITNNQWDN